MSEITSTDILLHDELYICGQENDVMFECGQIVFMTIACESQSRQRYRGVVQEVAARTVNCTFEDPGVRLNSGSQVVLYWRHQGRFLQCNSTLTGIRWSGGRETFSFATSGGSLTAESRASYRLAVVTPEIYASVPNYAATRLVDISSEGFGIIMKVRLPGGASFPVTISSADTSFSGQARIQTIKPMGNDLYRYGLTAEGNGSPLQKGLQKLTIEMQRARLKRISRIA